MYGEFHRNAIYKKKKRMEFYGNNKDVNTRDSMGRQSPKETI